MKLTEDLQKKLEQLEKYDAAYYNKSSTIDDAAYDVFKDSVVKLLPPDHPYLDKIGHPVSSSWPKEVHEIFMGSLNKENNEEAIRGWIKKVEQALGMKGLEFVIQPKIDGLSFEAKYENGKIKSVVSRGDNSIGENVLPNAKFFRNLPMLLPVKEKVFCRGEGVIYKDDFDALQKKTSNAYKNPRNAASGISRRFDGSHSKYIRFIAYDIMAKVKTEVEKIDTLKKLGFFTAVTNVCKSADDVIRVYKSVKETLRDKSPYEIDGLVLKLNSIELQERMGVQHNRPEGCLALKFGSDKATTDLKAIAIQIGRTGKFTPVAILEPVDLLGSTISKASLHNFAYIVENHIGVGAQVAIEKKGEIIPQVTDVFVEGMPYDKPTKCHSCGGSVVDDGVNLWCKNKVCRERDINRIVYWVETLDMKGFSGKFVEKLWDIGKVRSVADVYKLTPDDFIAVDGIGEKTVKSFFKTLKETSTMMLPRFITALGIPSCSKSTSEVLLEKFGSWDKIASLKPSDISVLPGFAETSSITICEGIAEVSDMAQQLLSVISIVAKKEGKLTGKSFCVTGSLVSVMRKEFEAVVIDNGGLIKNTVAEGLSFLVTNDTTSMSSKNQKARKLGVSVISEKQFFDMLGGMPAPKVVEIKKEDKIEIITEKLF